MKQMAFDFRQNSGPRKRRRKRTPRAVVIALWLSAASFAATVIGIIHHW